MRAATSAVLGGLAAVAGWAAWSMLAPPDAPPAPTADPVAAATVAAPAPPRVSRPDAPVAVAVAPSAAPTPKAPPPPVLRAGQVLEHGLPTALQASSDGNALPATAPAVPLPAGVRAEDAVVNAAGMVTLSRSPAQTPSGDAATAPPRPVTADRAR